MAARIENASPEQQDVLREITAGLPGTKIRRLRLARVEEVLSDWDAELRDLGQQPTSEQLARARSTALIVDGDRPIDLRTLWEATVLAQAFARLSEELGLPTVTWVQMPEHGQALDASGQGHETSAAQPAMEDQIRIAAATTGALIHRLEVLDPIEPSTAVTIAVSEPHAFLRHGLHAFLELSGHVRRFGSFVQVVDGELEPVWQAGAYRYGGMGGARADVQCCAPDRRGGLDYRGPPPCPALPRTHEDMLAAFRRNLRATTGRSSSKWVALVERHGPSSLRERFDWLQAEHGLGEVQPAAIVETFAPRLWA